ncbi:hypothetical protein TSUD_298960 [Trifolium subterraneum]|nr:hypothetical protein TSUD_298960 [Trifolium subterraneum]
MNQRQATERGETLAREKSWLCNKVLRETARDNQRRSEVTGGHIETSSRRRSTSGTLKSQRQQTDNTGMWVVI